jgi:hypothetical protein
VTIEHESLPWVILKAAQQLFETSGRLELPTVDAVRRLSKTNMNDASAVMKQWRRLQIVSASGAVSTELRGQLTKPEKPYAGEK